MACSPRVNSYQGGRIASAMTLRVLLLKASLRVARGPSAAGQEDGRDGVGHAGDRGQDDAAGDHSGHRRADAER